MREFIAKSVAVALGGSILALAAAFAHRQNLDTVAGPPVASEVVRQEPDPLTPGDSAMIPLGRAAADELACRRCHAIEGSGNPRSPLDGVGSRRSRTELRAWIVGAPSVRRALSSSAARAKASYADLPESDLAALTAFMSSLREEPGR